MTDRIEQTDKLKREKFTTNLTAECLKQINELRGLLGFKNLNEVIEYVIEKERNNYEMGKKRDIE